jgi:ABC-type multidrug transport system fused ATPase/permease subunit
MSAFQGIRESLLLLQPIQRKKLFLLVIFQFLTSILDLVAIALMGALTISFTVDNGSTKSEGMIFDLTRMLKSHFSNESEMLITLSILTISLFLIKSIISLHFSRLALRFLTNRSVEVASKLFEQLMSNSLVFVQKRPSQETISSINGGVTSAVLVILGSATVMSSEIGLLALLGLGLVFVDPLLTTFSFAYFAIIVFGLNRFLSNVGLSSGRERTLADIQSTSIIQESVAAFRELYVADKLAFTVSRLTQIRRHGSKAIADSQWIGLVPKYIMEFALIFGAGLLAGYQFLKNDTASVVGSLTVFLAAGSRILPSILRIQGAVSSMQTNIGSAEYTFRLIQDLNHEVTIEELSSVPDSRSFSQTFKGSILVNSVTFSYPTKTLPALSKISLEVSAGSSLAIVGSSGAGKSTLVDLMLGLHQPQLGSVLISEVNPQHAMKLWPGKVGYVPQTVSLFNSSIRENVAIARELKDIEDSRVWAALENAQLGDFVAGNSEGLDMIVGEHGVKLSGGQKQRLGLARALYEDPEILILDEATSALDSETEEAISKALMKLSNKVTRITIAHRLATVRKADKVIFMENGHIIAVGTFEEVRKVLPQFDHQANLLGL